MLDCVREEIGKLRLEVVGGDLGTGRILDINFVRRIIVIFTGVIEIQRVVTVHLEKRKEVRETVDEVVEEGDFVKLNGKFLEELGDIVRSITDGVGFVAGCEGARRC